MANGTIKRQINPPDFDTYTRVGTWSSGTGQTITSAGGWYCFIATTKGTADVAYATIGQGQDGPFYGCNTTPSAKYQRASTGWIYFPKGVEFFARGGFNNADNSGLYFAECLP